MQSFTDVNNIVSGNIFIKFYFSNKENSGMREASEFNFFL